MNTNEDSEISLKTSEIDGKVLIHYALDDVIISDDEDLEIWEEAGDVGWTQGAFNRMAKTAMSNMKL
jgi:hypothetical protein